jgi:hypothetical protein
MYALDFPLISQRDLIDSSYRRYDALILEQEAHSERTRRQALPSPPPDAIGISSNPDDATGQQGKANDAASVDVLGVPPRSSFWDQYRQQVADLTRAQRPVPREESSSAARGPAAVHGRGTTVPNRNRMILRSGREYRIG